MYLVCAFYNRSISFFTQSEQNVRWSHFAKIDQDSVLFCKGGNMLVDVLQFFLPQLLICLYFLIDCSINFHVCCIFSRRSYLMRSRPKFYCRNVFPVVSTNSTSIFLLSKSLLCGLQVDLTNFVTVHGLCGEIDQATERVATHFAKHFDLDTLRAAGD